jgi:hypothetical protein
MSKDSETKALVTVEAKEARNAELASFLGKFDMSMDFTPENLQMVTERARVTLRLHGAMEEVCVIAHGKHFLWMKAGLKHGEWLPHLKTYFADIPLRSIQWWMAEARYTIEHGHRQMRNAALLGAQGGAHFDDSDAEGFSADDLADPNKPAPKPRAELEALVLRLEKRLKAREVRDENFQEQIEELESRIKAEQRKKDPDETDEENCPIKTALLRGLLATGRAKMLIQDAVNMKTDFTADCPLKVLASVASQLQTNVQTISDLTGPLVIAAAHEHNRKEKAESAANKD